MSNINLFELDQYSDNRQRLNIDSLFEQKRQRDMEEMRLFNRILSRIQIKIKTASLQKKDNQWCWCTIPAIIIGASHYDQGSCIAYVQHHLQDNGFLVKYYHPDTLLVAWHHWVPSYTRNEIKKRYGVTLNERGEQIDNESENNKVQHASNRNGNKFFSVKSDNMTTNDHILFKGSGSGSGSESGTGQRSTTTTSSSNVNATPVKKTVSFRNPASSSSSTNNTPYVSISSYKPPENILDQI